MEQGVRKCLWTSLLLYETWQETILSDHPHREAFPQTGAHSVFVNCITFQLYKWKAILYDQITNILHNKTSQLYNNQYKDILRSMHIKKSQDVSVWYTGLNEHCENLPKKKHFMKINYLTTSNRRTFVRDLAYIMW